MKKPTVKKQLEELKIVHDKLIYDIVDTVKNEGAIQYLIWAMENKIEHLDKDIENELNYAKHESNSYSYQKKEARETAQALKKIKKKYELAFKALRLFESQLVQANKAWLE